MKVKSSHLRPTRLFWLFVGVLAVLLGTVIFLFIYHDLVWEWWRWAVLAWADKEKIKSFIKATGPLAPVVFILVQSLQVVLAPIPGEATGFIGGFLFGVPLGFLYSTIGLTLGSVGAFLLGRWLEVRFVSRVVSFEAMQKLDFLMEHQGALVAFFLFLIPGFPKDYLCFILGLSPMHLRLFLVISTIGRLPGTFLLTLQGAQLYKGNYLSTALIVGFCLLVGGLMYRYRETLYEWVRRLDTYHPQQRGEGEQKKGQDR